MKVKDLINKLEGVNPEMQVMVPSATGEYQYGHAESADVSEVWLHNHPKEESEETFVIDTKWKIIDPKKPGDDDLKQMYAYNMYWNSSKSMLLYPSSNPKETEFGSFHKGFAFDFFFWSRSTTRESTISSEKTKNVISNRAKITGKSLFIGV